MEVANYISGKDLVHLKMNIPWWTTDTTFTIHYALLQKKGELAVLVSVPGRKVETYFLLTKGRSWYRSEEAAALLEDS